MWLMAWFLVWDFPSHPNSRTASSRVLAARASCTQKRCSGFMSIITSNATVGVDFGKLAKVLIAILLILRSLAICSGAL